VDTPFREPAPPPAQEPPAPLATVAHDAEPARDEPSTMWVSDSEGRELERARQARALAMRMLGAAVVAVIVILFCLAYR
jgi:hypothetical protein